MKHKRMLECKWPLDRTSPGHGLKKPFSLNTFNACVFRITVQKKKQEKTVYFYKLLFCNFFYI